VVGLHTRRSLAAAACALLLFLAAKNVYVAHVMAMSEAPFFTFMLAVFACARLYAERPGLGWLLPMAAACGAAMVTRYIGVALLPPMIAAVVAVPDRPRRARIRDAALAASIACLPMAAWLVRNWLTAPSLTNRRLVPHLVGLEHVQVMANTLQEILLPGKASPLPAALHVGLLVLLGLLAAGWLVRTGRGREVPAALLLFGPVYLLMLLVSRSFFDAATKFGPRFLVPAFLAGAAAAFALAFAVGAAQRRPLAFWAFLVYVAGLAGLNASSMLGAARYVRANGQGYSARRFYESATLGQVMLLPAGLRIYSNGPDAVEFIAGRAAAPIPRLAHPFDGTPNPDYRRDLHAICAETKAGRAVVAYLEGVDRLHMPTRARFEADCDAPARTSGPDGALYGR
jgi:4-amino-4-deoxy-L-arabinose transferase-like glycosyltransferase